MSKIILKDDKAVPSTDKLIEKVAALKRKTFDSLKTAEKDELMKLVLERLGFIDALGIVK